MAARLIKETRDLLPAFASTLLLIVLPCLILPHFTRDERDLVQGLSVLALGVACVVMGGSAFGNEFQHRTLPLLLSQPIPRSVMWREKMMVLGAGMVTSLVVLFVCLAASGFTRGTVEWVMPVVIAVCAFCGAPFWTLLLRQGIGGMVAAVAVPCWIMVMTNAVGVDLADSSPLGERLATYLLLGYCAVAGWLGYAKFQRLEDVDGLSRELSLPAGLEAMVTRPLTRLSSGFQGPFAALVKKEFHLQQISFVLAGLFVLIGLAGFSLIKVRTTVAEGIVGGDLLIYVVILPLIAGAISVAEERSLGMAEWHLTLPPSALKQWSAKMLVALPTSLFLGLLLPAVIFQAGAVLLGRSSVSLSLPPASELLGICAVLCGWVLGQLLVTSVAVYAASFARNTLRAILIAFVIVAAGVGVFALVGREAEVILSQLAATFDLAAIVAHLPAWIDLSRVNEGLILPLFLVGLAGLLCLMQWLAWSNYRRHGPSTPRLLIQFTAILLSVGLFALIWFSALFLSRSHEIVRSPPGSSQPGSPPTR